MIEVVPYDPRWPALYAVEAERLRAALGPALREMEHVGSTSVPGLAAKPILDVMAAVDALADLDPHLPALAARGYRPVPTDMAGRLLLRREADREGDLPVHLHVVTLGSWPTRRERLFRDRLLAHPEEARAYGDLKLGLAGQMEGDIDAYTRAKTSLIQAIMDRAADDAGVPRASVWDD